MRRIKNYDGNFTSSSYSHRKEKEKASKRRYNDEVIKKREFRRAKDGSYPTYYICDKKNVYEIRTMVEPAHYEEEKYFLIKKGAGEYLYTDKKGTKHYADLFGWITTGSPVYKPKKVRKIRKVVGTISCKPYIKHYSLTKRKKWAKKLTTRKIRRSKDYKNFDHSPSGYQRYFDYDWEVW